MAAPKAEAAVATCGGERAPKSFNYTARSERVDPRAGVYWVPATEFSSAPTAARSDPRVLNGYAFVAFGRRSS